MGEIADDLVEGRSCSYCGCYFISLGNANQLYTHGYPVICKGCWGTMNGKERAEAVRNGLSRALVRTM